MTSTDKDTQNDKGASSAAASTPDNRETLDQSAPIISDVEEDPVAGLSTHSQDLESSENPHKNPTTQTISNVEPEFADPSASVTSGEETTELEQLDQSEDEEDLDDADTDSDDDDDFPRFEDNYRGRIVKPVSGQKPPKPK